MRYSYLLLSLIFFACNPKNEIKLTNNFFNLKDYFKRQSELLQKNKIHLNKKIAKDGKEENIDFETINWEKELRPFEDCDLNKPAWKKSYQVDTFYLSSQTHLLYKALEPKLSIRKLEVIFRSDTVYMINILLEKNNAYYQSHQQLHYEPWKGYNIIGSQKVIFTDSTTFNIKAVFN